MKPIPSDQVHAMQNSCSNANYPGSASQESNTDITLQPLMLKSANEAMGSATAADRIKHIKQYTDAAQALTSRLAGIQTQFLLQSKIDSANKPHIIEMDSQLLNLSENHCYTESFWHNIFNQPYDTQKFGHDFKRACQNLLTTLRLDLAQELNSDTMSAMHEQGNLSQYLQAQASLAESNKTPLKQLILAFTAQVRFVYVLAQYNKAAIDADNQEFKPYDLNTAFNIFPSSSPEVLQCIPGTITRVQEALEYLNTLYGQQEDLVNDLKSTLTHSFDELVNTSIQKHNIIQNTDPRIQIHIKPALHFVLGIPEPLVAKQDQFYKLPLKNNSMQIAQSMIRDLEQLTGSAPLNEAEHNFVPLLSSDIQQRISTSVEEFFSILFDRINNRDNPYISDRDFEHLEIFKCLKALDPEFSITRHEFLAINEDACSSQSNTPIMKVNLEALTEAMLARLSGFFIISPPSSNELMPTQPVHSDYWSSEQGIKACCESLVTGFDSKNLTQDLEHTINHLFMVCQPFKDSSASLIAVLLIELSQRPQVADLNNHIADPAVDHLDQPIQKGLNALGKLKLDLLKHSDTHYTINRLETIIEQISRRTIDQKCKTIIDHYLNQHNILNAAALEDDSLEFSHSDSNKLFTELTTTNTPAFIWHKLTPSLAAVSKTLEQQTIRKFCLLKDSSQIFIRNSGLYSTFNASELKRHLIFKTAQRNQPELIKHLLKNHNLTCADVAVSLASINQLKVHSTLDILIKNNDYITLNSIFEFFKNDPNESKDLHEYLRNLNHNSPIKLASSCNHLQCLKLIMKTLQDNHQTLEPLNLLTRQRNGIFVFQAIVTQVLSQKKSPSQFGVSDKSFEIIQWVLSHDIDVYDTLDLNPTLKDVNPANTPLYLAVKNNHFEYVDLLAHTPQDRLKGALAIGSSAQQLKPLQIAAHYGHKEMTQSLFNLYHRLNMNIPKELISAELHRQPHILATRQGHWQILDIYKSALSLSKLQHITHPKNITYTKEVVASLHAYLNGQQFNGQHKQPNSNDLLKTIQWYESLGFNCNDLNRADPTTGRRLLNEITRLAFESVSLHLLNSETQLDLTTEDNSGDTLLHIAMQQGSERIVQKILHLYPLETVEDALLTPNNNAMTPLVLAVRPDNSKILNAVLLNQQLITSKQISRHLIQIVQSQVLQLLADVSNHSSPGLYSNIQYMAAWIDLNCTNNSTSSNHLTDNRLDKAHQLSISSLISEDNFNTHAPLFLQTIVYNQDLELLNTLFKYDFFRLQVSQNSLQDQLKNILLTQGLNLPDAKPQQLMHTLLQQEFKPTFWQGLNQEAHKSLSTFVEQTIRSNDIQLLDSLHSHNIVNTIKTEDFIINAAMHYRSKGSQTLPWLIKNKYLTLQEINQYFTAGQGLAQLLKAAKVNSFTFMQDLLDIGVASKHLLGFNSSRNNIAHSAVDAGSIDFIQSLLAQSYFKTQAITQLLTTQNNHMVSPIALAVHNKNHKILDILSPALIAAELKINGNMILNVAAKNRDIQTFKNLVTVHQVTPAQLLAKPLMKSSMIKAALKPIADDLFNPNQNGDFAIELFELLMNHGVSFQQLMQHKVNVKRDTIASLANKYNAIGIIYWMQNQTHL